MMHKVVPGRDWNRLKSDPHFGSNGGNLDASKIGWMSTSHNAESVRGAVLWSACLRRILRNAG